MNTRVVAAVLVSLGLILAAVWWMGFMPEVPKETPDPKLAAEALNAQEPGDSQPPRDAEGTAEISGSQGNTTLQSKLQALAAELSAQTSVEGVKAVLARLKEAVHAASPDEAARQLIALLESGIDQSTGLEFLVGTEGVMEESPTLRTALLDLLGQTDPTQSAPYSRRVMATTGSSDEYALALRNLAWTNNGGALDAELQGYFEQMLGRADWSSNPTDGFLEAYDVAVATKNVGALVPVITQATKDGNQQAEAAFLAMDRVMLSDPAAVVAAFQSDPAFLSEAPMHRASLLSRLDVRQPDQSRLLREYLLRPDVGAEEREYFTNIFPNGNRVVGHRLVTTDEPGGSAADVAQIDRATLGTLTAWLNDPPMASRRTEIKTMIARLQDYVGIRGATPGR